VSVDGHGGPVDAITMAAATMSPARRRSALIMTHLRGNLSASVAVNGPIRAIER
jgi:hypothetical protein